MPHKILGVRVEKGVGNWAARRYGIEEEVERVSACTKLDLDVGIERIVVDRLDQRALDKVSGAGHQHQRIGNVTDRLIGVADLVVDVDGPSGGDHADEQADPDQHLETEGDETHPLSANARQQNGRAHV